MLTTKAYGREACSVLSVVGWPVLDAVKQVDSVPGLYAISAAANTWSELGLEFRAGIPLYVGKSESSLAGRDLGQHFATDPTVQAQTGSSTVRRSFAALLQEPLGLHGVPRNKENPERFANFGLEPEGDCLLTRWMHQHLSLSVWPMPEGLPVSKLERVEINVIVRWTPPLNIAHNPARLQHLQEARSLLAFEAEQWAVNASKEQ